MYRFGLFIRGQHFKILFYTNERLNDKYFRKHKN